MATLVVRVEGIMRDASVGDLATYLRGWEQSLRAANRSPRTIAKYLEAGRFLVEFLHDRGMPSAVDAVRREHVEAFFEHKLLGSKATTVATQYQSLLQFFKFLLEEGEIATSPMANTSPPIIPQEDVPIVTDAELATLLKSCSGRDFAPVRDTAIIRLFVDTGLRLSELADLQVDDVDLDRGELATVRKGRRPRVVPYNPKAGQALERYLRARRKHPAAATSPWLWLGTKGRMTGSGIQQMLRRRSTAAIGRRIHPHQLRHTKAHRWLSKGGSERGLMRIMDWRSPAMLGRYASISADQRAAAEQRRLAEGDDL